MKLLAVLLALVACGKQHERGPIDYEKAKGLFEQVPIAAPPGMSDLTIDDRGVMWAVPERDREVISIELGKEPVRHALEGVSGAVDTEGIAWLGGNRFAFGTEGANEPTASILFAELRDGKMVVTRSRSLTNDDLGVKLTHNHGIEAVCGNDRELLAASETVGRLPDGTRYAPVVRLTGDALHVTKVRLTTKEGKLSALYCVFDANGTAQVTAIERHFGVARILSLAIKRDDVEVTPTVELDLYPILRNARNLEGIVRLPDGRLVTINDNQSKRAEGPTELLVFQKR